MREVMEEAGGSVGVTSYFGVSGVERNSRSQWLLDSAPRLLSQPRGWIRWRSTRTRSQKSRVLACTGPGSPLPCRRRDARMGKRPRPHQPGWCELGGRWSHRYVIDARGQHVRVTGSEAAGSSCNSTGGASSLPARWCGIPAQCPSSLTPGKPARPCGKQEWAKRDRKAAFVAGLDRLSPHLRGQVRVCGMRVEWTCGRGRWSGCVHEHQRERVHRWNGCCLGSRRP